MTSQRSLLTSGATALFATASALYALCAYADDDVTPPVPGMYGLPNDNPTHRAVRLGVQRQPCTEIAMGCAPALNQAVKPDVGATHYGGCIKNSARVNRGPQTCVRFDT